MNKISEKKREAMFAAFQEKQTNNYVSRKCRVASLTVRRYRKKDNWDKRTAQIKEKAHAKIDDKLAKATATWIALGIALQNVGKSKFYDEKGKLKPEVIKKMSAFEGIKAITDGIRVQREAMGEPGEISQLNLQIELVDGD